MTTLLDRPATRPEAGTWLLEPDTAVVGFRGRAHRFAPLVSAVFRQVRGVVSLTADGQGRVEVDVDVRSLTTGSAAYDELLARVDPFDAARHPVARFTSRCVTWSGGAAMVDGTMAAGGGSTSVQLRGRYRCDGDRTALQVCGVVDRQALGLSLDVPGQGLLVPRRLELHVDVQAVRTA